MTELGALYRGEHARVLAAVLARVRDYALAEDAVAEAFAAAATWTAPPPNPRAWLVRVAVNKCIDQLRARARRDHVPLDDDVAAPMPGLAPEPVPDATDDDAIGDDRLRLIFLCCHPALGADARVALTLRTVAGLATDEIARLFATEPSAMAQRLVRAQTKIRDARIPYALPRPDQLAERVDAVLSVLYLVFTEGYAATAGDALVRPALCDEAIRLARLVAALMPADAEARALLALMLVLDARRDARITDGELVLLEDQDRSRWDRARLAEGTELLDAALAGGARGSYAIQASIAALHARDHTDWAQIVELYDLLVVVQPTPQVELNRAIAIARGPDAGLAALDRLKFALAEHHLFHAARADVLARLGRTADAARALRRALELVTHPVEQRWLARRLAALTGHNL